jgi:23S rRNA (uracil1939-C5)-methyltransferase
MEAVETNAIDVLIEKLVYGGDGLGRVEGQVVLVPFVLPGEKVRVAVERARAGLLEAKLLEVLSAAPSRTDPPCPYFQRCGGCHYQHLGYQSQLEQKRVILEEVFRRVGKLEPPQPDPVASPPWEYRNRSQLHLQGGEIGYFEHGSHRLCPVQRCPISSPKINETLAALRGMLRDPRFPHFVKSIELFTNETEVQLNVLATQRPVSRRFFEWCGERIPGLVAAIDYSAAGATWRVRHRSFFQVNRFLIEALLERALAAAEGETALDLYAGVGLFSLPLARRFQKVTAVESARSAAADLEFNAARAGLSVEIKQNAADLFLLDLTQAPDFVLADPPRAGLGKRVVGELLRLRPPRITIISCDPATLARDLAPLAAGGYRIERLSLIDLFPQTYHIETVTHLVNKGKEPVSHFAVADRSS